jgi:hypothetical protein
MYVYIVAQSVNIGIYILAWMREEALKCRFPQSKSLASFTPTTALPLLGALRA